MTQERVIAQVKPRLQTCLEQRDRAGILALTAWLVHRYGYPLLQQLLSQREWAGHRLWWGRQLSHPNPVPEPQTSPQPRSSPKTQTPMATKGLPDPWETTPAPQQHPGPEEGLRRDGDSAQPANPAASSGQDADNTAKLTPAQVTKQRLKAGQPAKSTELFPMQEQDGAAPIMPQATNQEQTRQPLPKQKQRSRYLRDWLPRSRLPHQNSQQDAA